MIISLVIFSILQILGLIFIVCYYGATYRILEGIERIVERTENSMIDSTEDIEAAVYQLQNLLIKTNIEKDEYDG